MSGGDPAELPKASAERHLQEAMQGSLNDILAALIENGQRLLRSEAQASSPAKPKQTGILTRLWRRLVNQDQGQDKDQDLDQEQDQGQDQGQNQNQANDLLVPEAPKTMPPSTRPHATSLMIRQTLQQAEQLKEDYKQTDEMIDKLFRQATEINRELVLRNKMIKKIRLLRELEAKYAGSMYVQLEVIRTEFNSI